MNEIERSVREILYSTTTDIPKELTDYITGLLDKVVPEKVTKVTYDEDPYGCGSQNDCVDIIKQNIAKLKDSNLAREVRETEEK